MDRSRALYWTVTGVMASFMLMASIPDVLHATQALAIFQHLGYPSYLLRFLGTAKCLGIVAILAPGFPRLKEWAFAGLMCDLLGALYSHLSVGDPPTVWVFPVVGLTLVTVTYLAYRSQATQPATASRFLNVPRPELDYSVGRDVSVRSRRKG